MKYKTISYYFVATLLSLLFSCENKEDTSTQKNITSLIAQIQNKYAPDKRVELFNIKHDFSSRQVTLTGESTSSDAVKELNNAISKLGWTVADSITLLPHSNLGDSTFGLINNSVGNIRSKNKHSAELATQALLGTPVRVLKRSLNKEWYLIQTPDRYISWIDHGAIKIITKTELEFWKNAKKVVYSEINGYALKEIDKKEVISDLVLGCILISLGKEKDYIKVLYPDGRTGFVKRKEVTPYQEWLARPVSIETILETSLKMNGSPYLWGGTSSKGIDCSGFTKSAYLATGIVIPRDASQQVHEGKTIDKDGNFDLLEPGDLLFFGRAATESNKERVVHVGIWIGDNKMIHSSGQVKISSFDSTKDNYDAFNQERYLRSKRILGHNSGNLIDLRKRDLYSLY